MGTIGKRPQKIKGSEYEEPKLLKDIDQIINLAKDENLYEGEKLKIEDLIICIAQKEKERIAIEYLPMDASKSGSLKFDGNKWIMTVNKLHNPKRQRYTLAHELGHFILHKNKNMSFEETTFFRNEERSSLEYMANEFAGNLLMPDDKIRDSIKKGQRNLSALAEEYGVSAAAMKYKIIKLGYKLGNNG